jgi:hypothetical protein
MMIEEKEHPLFEFVTPHAPCCDCESAQSQSVGKDSGPAAKISAFVTGNPDVLFLFPGASLVDPLMLMQAGKRMIFASFDGE